MNTPLRTLAFAAGMLAFSTLTAFAGFKFDPTAKPASAATIRSAIAGHSWDWGGGKGVSFAADGTFMAVGGFDKTEVGKGTWTATDGKLCWDAVWIGKSKETKTPFCWSAMEGPAKDGKITFKVAFGLKGQDKPDYFWVTADGKTAKAFLSGDRFSAKAKKLLAGWGKS
ncbi:MAG TPA: DUF995 domain-containing protein [Kaistia sp.]|nr:DUF995 domain-containing protein [Kaistia sp.]